MLKIVGGVKLFFDAIRASPLHNIVHATAFYSLTNISFMLNDLPILIEYSTGMTTSISSEAQKLMDEIKEQMFE